MPLRARDAAEMNWDGISSDMTFSLIPVSSVEMNELRMCDSNQCRLLYVAMVPGYSLKLINKISLLQF